MAATIMCHYCFEILENKLRLGGQKRQTDMSDLRASSAFGLQVRWWKKTPASERWQSMGTVVSGSLNRSTSLDVALREMALKSSEGIEVHDLKRDLYCQVSLIKKATWARVANVCDDWTLGKDGLMLEWHNVDDQKKGKSKSRQFMLPGRPMREHWSAEETLRYLLEKAGGDDAMHALDQVDGDVQALADRFKLFKFRVSERTASVKDYRTWRRNRKRTLREAKHGAKEHSRFSAAVLFGVVALLVAGFLALRLNEATYDVNYDDFLENYDILGVPRETPVNEVRRAYRKLSLKLHPDKVGSCDDSCEDRWVRIVEAYQQITDRESGKLKIIRH